MATLRQYAEDYVNYALKKQSSSVKKEQKKLLKLMNNSKKNYIKNYISGRELRPKSKDSLKQAAVSFDHRVQSVVTLMNEENAKKNCAFTNQDSCLNIGGLNYCRWEPIKKKCLKVTKSENLPMPYKYFDDKGRYTPKQMRQHSKVGGPNLITEHEKLKREIERNSKGGKRRKTRKRKTRKRKTRKKTKRRRKRKKKTRRR